MKYSGSYAIVLALHLLTVAFVVGPSAVAGMVSARHARKGHAEALRDAARTTRLYGLGTLVTVLLGTALIELGGVGEQWDIAQGWVSASYALWIVALALTLGMVVPTQNKAAKAIEGGGSAEAFVGRLAAGSGLAMLAWTAIVVLMVAKPGA